MLLMLLTCRNNSSNFSGQDNSGSANKAPTQDKEVIVMAVVCLGSDVFLACFTSRIMWSMLHRKQQKMW